ncbi:MAG: lysophospholipid acyltransferase family protein [Deltaproteobacteria bacterium]|nr:lysophospholipid acyltransferase family protein [Deltaproteobacteria bacterium]
MLNLLTYLLTFLPWGVLNPLLSLLTYLRLLLWRKERTILFLNIEKIWGLPPHSSFAKSFAYQTLRSQAQIFAETIKAVYAADILKVSGMDDFTRNLQTLENSPVGSITITAHVGNWEWVGRFSAEHSHGQFYALAKKSRRPSVDRWIERLRSKMGVSILDAEAKSTLRRMIMILKNRDNLGFVMDQKPKGRQGPIVSFFKQATPFVSGPAMMAAKLEAPVLAVFCLREGPMQYRLLSEILLPPGHSEKDIPTITQRFATKIEGIIRMYPEQWCWNYKRWRWENSEK